MGKPRQGKDPKGKKLSWSYRNKKKRLGKPTETESENIQVQNKKGRIVIRNLSFKITEGDVRRLYEPFGEIEEINLLRRPDGKPVGCGFVQFKRVTDASKAIFQTNKQEVLGRPINTDWAISKDKYYEKVKKEENPEEESENVVELKENKEKEDDDDAADAEKEEKEEEKSVKKKNKKNQNLNKAEERKLQKNQKRKKRARIVVRNLSFKATEENIKEHFSQHGKVEDVQILKKPNGTPIGCAFVQFERVQSAAQAIHYLNLKPLLDREVVVDWAVPKSKFNTTPEVKHEEIDITDETEGETKIETDIPVEIKEEPETDDDDDDDEKASVKSEDDDASVKSEKSDDDDEDEEDDENDDEDEENDDDDDDEDEKDEKKFKIEEDDDSRPRRVSNDVSEGKTVFLKNVPFQAKNEDLKYCMEQFGPVFYALVCVDPLTEHSKGTAFVKFRNVEDAEKCLAAGTELKIFDQILDPHRALHKNEVVERKNIKSEKVKDSRNLYLVKEGVILARHPSAVGVSAQDIEKRLQLERWKSQILRNLNMFVSRIRLVVQNLPPSMNDSQLREIFKKHSGPNAVISEARVMRNLRKPDANGIGESKEYGFVSFTSHEDALKALRSINNNPNIFSKQKRPIVAFSIENRVIINAKQKRFNKSRENNPLWTGNKEKSEEPQKKRRKFEKEQKPKTSSDSYQGIMSQPSKIKGKPTFKVEKQAGLYKDLLKNQKKQTKMAKFLKQKKQNEAQSRREIKPKQGKKKVNSDEKNFTKLVNSYKQKLVSSSQVKSKWYDT
ncbi:RNA-binding protein 28-like isoform X2 [Leptopilina heterotoma]|uniref:RNA-binding protein 28-like isoform X2 n=1 Tax=Leptopilina heterotoma TaxID=63436 RepID=UPI001CAA36CE|nr:RNA-binding protein 28-like isoform X2 [Leptopilina heterotoma]